ncbi:MAG: HD family phosphohydrolase [Bacillus sp. (in: firmicutes)]
MMDMKTVVAKMKTLLQNIFFQILLFILLAITSYGVMFSNVKPEKVSVELFEVADATIRSPRTVEDTERTKAEQEEAVKEVQDVYELKKEYAQNRVDLLSSIFASVREVKKESSKAAEGNEADQEQLLEDQVEALKKKLSDEMNKNFTDDIYRSLLKATDSELSVAEDVTVTAVNTVMSSRIRSDDVENAKMKAEEEIRYASMNSGLKTASITMARFAVTANTFYDKAKTLEQQEIARENVEPVKILQGQILVEKGHIVDREVYRNLQIVGLLNTETSPYPFIGLALLIVIIFGFLFFFYKVTERDNQKRNNQIMLLSIVFLISMAIMKVFSLLSITDDIDLGYFVPAALGTMLLKILLNNRYAILFTIITSIFGSIIFNENMTTNFNLSIAFYFLLSGLGALLLLSEKRFRGRLLQVGLLLSIIQFMMIVGLYFIQDIELSRADYITYLVASFVSALTSSILATGILPFFEAGFGILSPLRLIELSNPNHPLLKRILTDAPGTYHHSIMVANLAETACEAIGANGLLARVGCYYHDIGKTKRPQFFIENQMNIENPHDRLKPETSRDIIISHVSDGVKILRKYKMPKEIIDIAEQHHGTTLLKFFYFKAKEEDEHVKEEAYRYPGPKAQTKESAIIGIADSVEAAVRSMSHPTKEKIEALIRSIINDRIKDNQFSECDITFRQLEIVEKSLCQTLNGIFHSRIEYPDMKNET